MVDELYIFSLVHILLHVMMGAPSFNSFGKITIMLGINLCKCDLNKYMITRFT